MVELTADLLFNSYEVVRLGEAGRPDGMGSGSQCMRLHVADCRHGRRPHVARPHATFEPLGNALGRAQLSPGVCARAGNKCPRTIIVSSIEGRRSS
jgi:hypothetical protein